jgi:LmbE family N-acetylglucosaminyl deacetylase
MVDDWARTRLLIAAEDAPFVDPAMLSGSGGVLVLAPHPDDESLGCGGAIAMLARRDVRVAIAVITDGSLSHPKSQRYPAAHLAALRHEEVREAARILTGNDASIHWLGYPDCSAPSDEQEIDAATSRLVEIAEDIDATSVWATWTGDPHCDHKSAAALALALRERRPATALWSYPIWGRFSDEEATALDGSCIVRVDTCSVNDTKARAIAAHLSQMTALIDDDPDGFIMPSDKQRHFVETPEIFIREE